MVHAQRVTLSDVATRAGVSVTTASYILNGRSAQMRIAAETERRVQAAIEELDYRPNWSARALRRSTNHTIGLISDSVASGAFANQLLAGVSAGARALGHLLVIGETLGDRDVEHLLIEEMLDRQFDGIVYATLAATTVHLPPPLHQGRTLLLNCTDPELDLPSVMPDDEGAGRAAARLLVEAGVTGPLYVVGEDSRPEATAAGLRLLGVRTTLEEAGLQLAGMIPCPWNPGSAYDAVHAWLADGARPGGLICLNDRVALGVYQALGDHRLDVPGDVSVVSFDGSDLASWMRPRLTSLALPFDEMGRRAASTLLSPDWKSAGHVLLQMEVQCGGSIAEPVPATSAPGPTENR